MAVGEVVSLAVDDCLIVSVRDHGPGIAPNLRARIFKPFERLETEAATPGVGLGLAISAELAGLMRGSLTCKNPDDGKGGAQCVLSIPRAVTMLREGAPHT